MIETVQERQRGAYNFENYYDNLCALQDTCPIPAVKGHLPDGILDINGDRIRQQDWLPIFNSIKINKSLKFIAIRSYFQLNLDNGMPEKKAKIMRSRIPVIRTKEMTVSLCKVLRDCLATTESLECLELQGIHLRESDLTLIGQGLMKNSTLKHLSMETCRIGDPGLVILCSAMKMAGNISTLNLTSCSLSPIGIRALGDLIKFQAMSRHNEAWKESLRYRWANFDTMCGIRRMTLNRNLGIGEEGALIIAESLKDDLWVKAIDLQECSMTNNSVRAFLKVLKFNSTLVVLDLRRNPMIDRDLLKSVTEQVLVNGDGKETEFKWLRVKDLLRNDEENHDRHPRSYYNGPKKPLDFVARPAFKPAGRLRSKSASSIDRRTNDNGNGEIVSKSSIIHEQIESSRNLNNFSKGQPWRTAARATRYKGYPPDHVPGKSNIEEHCEDYNKGHQTEKPIKKQDRVIDGNQLAKKSNIKLSSMDKQESTTTDDEQTSSVVSPMVNGAAQYPPLPETVKDLKTEIFHLRVQLAKYQKDKSEIEMRLDEICNENKRLRNTIKLMSKTNAVIAERTEKTSIMQNEAMLEAIENSFKQFNAFLDMLRQSGLGKIVTAAGMDDYAKSQDFLHGINLDNRLKMNNQMKNLLPNGKESNGDPIRISARNEIDKKKTSVHETDSCNDDHPEYSLHSSLNDQKQSFHNSKDRKSNDSPHQKHHLGENTKSDPNKEFLEFIGWKDNNDIPQNSNKNSVQNSKTEASRELDMSNEGIMFDKDSIDNLISPAKSIMDAPELPDYTTWDNQNDHYQSSTSSLVTNSKVTKATKEAQPGYLEDSTIVTESIGNGMDNDVAINNLYAQQLSLDTAQDISFDTSNRDLF